MNKKSYSLKNSLNLLNEFQMSSTPISLSNATVSLNDIDLFFRSIENNEIIFNMENNSSYNYLSFKEILLICCLLEELKNDKLNETVTLKNSIKKEFSFLFEQITRTEEFSINKFSSFIRSLVHKISGMEIKKPVWQFQEERNISKFECDFFEMTTPGNYTGKKEDRDPPEVNVSISRDFEQLVSRSAFIKRNAGFYFEDLLMSIYSDNDEINLRSSSSKEKIASIITILLKYDGRRNYSKMNFSESFNKISGYNFDAINYENMLKMHKAKVIGLPRKEKIGKTLFDDENNIEIIDANSIQHNCGFDFLMLGSNNRGSIIDLKTHHESSISGFDTNSISTNTIHFLNSILKVINNNDEYENLQFNSIGLFKVSWEISNKNIKINRFEIRYDSVEDFVSSIKADTNSSLKLTDSKKTISMKEINNNEIVTQSYRNIDVQSSYNDMFNAWSKNAEDYFDFIDNKIVIPAEIILNGENEKKKFVNAVKAIVSSSVINNYPQTQIFSDENKIRIIDAFVIGGKKIITYNPDPPTQKKGGTVPTEAEKNKKTTTDKRYFYNSTLVITIMNNLSLQNKKDKRFQKILSIANDINAKANTQSRRLNISGEESAPYFQKSIKDILGQINFDV